MYLNKIIRHGIERWLSFFWRNIFNSHAGGKAVVRPYCYEIDFERNSISGSSAWFFVIIVKFIFTLIFEIKIYEKILDVKKISFSKSKWTHYAWCFWNKRSKMRKICNFMKEFGSAWLGYCKLNVWKFHGEILVNSEARKWACDSLHVHTKP